MQLTCKPIYVYVEDNLDGELYSGLYGYNGQTGDVVHCGCLYSDCGLVYCKYPPCDPIGTYSGCYQVGPNVGTCPDPECPQ